MNKKLIKEQIFLTFQHFKTHHETKKTSNSANFSLKRHHHDKTFNEYAKIET